MSAGSEAILSKVFGSFDRVWKSKETLYINTLRVTVYISHGVTYLARFSQVEGIPKAFYESGRPGLAVALL